MTTQNTQDSVKAVPRGKFIAIQEYKNIATSRNKKKSNRQPNYTPKTTGKRREKPPKLIERKKS